MPACIVQSGSFRLALALSGGNALGAYHAGIYQAVEEAGWEPDLIAGTSIGAVTGAILAGNRRDQRLDRLRELWRPAAADTDWPSPLSFGPDSWRRNAAVIQTLLAGQPGLFGPLGSSWIHDPKTGSPALYDTQSMNRTLAALIDFELLNDARPRFIALAIDVESGEEVELDAGRGPLTPDHVRASAALLTTYPAVQVDGRLLGDGGLSANLPLDPVMRTADATPTLCIASDLLPLSSGPPTTLGAVISRMQDLIFAAQSRRTLERWHAALPAGRGLEEVPSITVVRTAYHDQDCEVAGKAMDFSPSSVRMRWDAGLADGRRLIERLNAGEIPIGEPGLRVEDPDLTHA
jgi:NTE family protein